MQAVSVDAFSRHTPIARVDMRLFKGKVSIIMPAYNEGHHIYGNLKEAVSVFGRSKCRFEIILADDGSSDNTYAEAKRAADDFGGIVPVRLSRNGGKGNALKEGFRHATGDYVIFLDADLDLHPKQVYSMLRTMRDRQSDIVIGSKHHPESKLKYPLARKAMSRAYAEVLKVLFGLPLRDTQTGLKIFTYDSLDKVFPRVRCGRYAFDVELLANAHNAGYRVVESPVVLDYRRAMKWGRIRFKDVFRMGLDTMAIFYRLQFQKYPEREFEVGKLGVRATK